MTHKISIDLPSLEATQQLAEQMATDIQVGDVITLRGTLGAGKTTFARAFIQAWLGAPCTVPSPTFTLVQIYEKAEQTLYHFDLYRLNSIEEVLELGIEEALYTGITLIEWPERLLNMPLENPWQITFEFAHDPASRKAEIQASRERLASLNLKK